MATYAKKKRSLLPGFSVFRDDQAATAKAAAPNRLERAKTAMYKSRGHERMDDDSADELASDSLLGNPAQQPMRSSLQSDVPISEYSQSKSERILAEDRNKPLPPIPPVEPPVDLKQPNKARPVLASKSTNHKVLRKAEAAHTRPKISYPILQESEDNDHNTALRAMYGPANSRGTRGPQTSINDAEILSQKISSLMQLAATREAEQALRSNNSSATNSTKASPLQRSKAAIVKATQAITGRRSSTSRAKADDFLGIEYEAEPKKPQGAISPRSEVTKSSFPRKPLPVYESMKSRGNSFESSRNPFLDKDQGSGQLSPEIQAKLDIEFDFNKRKGKGRRPDQEQPTYPGSPLRNATDVAADSQNPRVFSDRMSGLAQHPDTMIFSSPPIGFSTPSDRLQPLTVSPQDSPLSKSFAQSPSILDFSFEESDYEDALSRKNSDEAKRSLSIKRKSAREDLRSQPSQSSKRAKKIPEDQMDLATKLQPMDADEKGPLIERDPNAKSSRPATADSKRKGLSMFDMAMGKGASDGVGDKAKRPRTRHAANRLSIPTPNSILFSRESRAHYRLRETTDGDTGDMDELAMDDGGYRVRSVKKS